MAETWPATLPQIFLQAGYAEGDVDNLIVTAVDTGPQKRRPKSTQAYLPISATMNLTLAQKVTFDTFYNTTIAFGAEAFTMPTYGGGTIQVFMNSKRLSPLSGTSWRLAMELITLVGPA